MSSAGGWQPGQQPVPGGPPAGWGQPGPGQYPPGGYGGQGYQHPGYQQPAYQGGYPPAPPSGPPGYGPQAPPGMYFDPPSGLNLPNGTALASSGRRIGAWFLSIVLSIVTLGIGYIIWGAIVWGRGQTPALQVLGMRCWRPESGRVPGWWWMALREVVGSIAEGILGLITQLISFIMMLTGAQRKTIHDMVAGTVVLYDPNKVLGR